MSTRINIRCLSLMLGILVCPLGLALAVTSWFLRHPTIQEYERGQQSCPLPVGKAVGYWVGAYANKDQIPFLGLDGYLCYKDSRGQMHRGTRDELMPIISADLGFWGLQFDTSKEGIIVLQVVPGLSAAATGLRKGDVITKWGDTVLQAKPIAELGSLLALHRPSTLTVLRDNEAITLDVPPDATHSKRAG